MQKRDNILNHILKIPEEAHIKQEHGTNTKKYHSITCS